MLGDWNATNAAIPSAAVHELVDAQASRTPHALAVAAGGESLTYACLTQRATVLARLLRARGVGPESLVAVCLDRSVDLVVALLGVLKAGGAYLPLEPSTPRARIKAILEDAGASLVITRTALRNGLPHEGPPRLCVDGDAHADPFRAATLRRGGHKSGSARIRHLHVGIHRHTERRRDHAPVIDESGRVAPAYVPGRASRPRVSTGGARLRRSGLGNLAVPHGWSLHPHRR